jgi:hypothetical protein
MKLRVALLSLLIACVSLAVGFTFGVRRGQFQSALEEAKVARAALLRDDIVLEPQLREYLKGRIYYVIGMKFHDSSYLSKSGWDVGTLNMDILKRPFYAKDSTFSPRTYDEAIAKQ